jgi:ankyrin repeat protein
MSLKDAIAANDISQVRNIISSMSQYDLKSLGTTESLAFACDEGYVDIVRALLDSGVSINDQNNVMYPHMLPISRSASRGHTEIVEMLIDSGAEVNIPFSNTEYWTPLMCGVSSGVLEIVRNIVEAGANVNDVKDGGVFALSIAVERGYQDIVDYLMPLTQSDLQQLL